MPILTESQIRDLIRQPQPGMTLTVAPGTRLSPAAQDFVNHWKLEVQVGTPPTEDEPAVWDKPAAFPVQVTGETPICSVCGMPVSIKPEHMTQLDAVHYAPKNIPRIRLRGKLDTLQGLCLLIGARARAQGCPALAEYLDTLAAYCREMMSAEYNDRPVASLALGDVDENEIHKATHEPEEVLGIPHLVPTSHDPELLHWLNVLRCESREVELVALDAFASGPDYRVAQPALVRAVNRFSSAVYYVELRYMAGKL